MPPPTPRNRYYRRSHLSEMQFRRLLRLFALDLTATDAADLTGLTRKNVTAIYLRLRGRLAEASARAAPWTPVEVDEAYFGARRVRHGAGEYVRQEDATTTHVNGIEGFWSFAKHRVAKFHGVAPHTFHLHLKECEWRFNTRRERRCRALLALLEEHPL